MLDRDDPSPVVLGNPQGRSAYILVGDHAGRAIPRRLGDLGVPASVMDQHVALDIGVEGLGGRLSQLIDAPFIRQAYSRLVIDCNRAPEAADASPAVSDGIAIPANQDLARADRARRVAEIHAPYHAAVDALLAARVAAGAPTMLVSLHSFTPVMQGFARPWRYGVLHRSDSSLSRRVLHLLQAELGEEAVGDNEPYALDEKDYTVPLHAGRHGLDYLELEVRQDLIADDAGQAEAAALVGRLLTAALANRSEPPA